MKQVIKIGEWKGGDLTLMLPASKASMKVGEGAVMLVQGGSRGPIVARVKI